MQGKGLPLRNEWATIPELIKATGIARGNASNVIYRAKKDQFEWEANPKKRRQRLLRLQKH